MTKFSWNRLVRTTIDIKVKDLWKHRITSDITLQPFLEIHDKFGLCVRTIINTRSFARLL